MKTILVLLDGLADRSYGSLGHRTPLEAADTPNLDRLAALGCTGLYHASIPGRCLPSETAHYLLFGYGLDEFPGRGLLEASGFGLPFADRDVLCLAHLFHAEAALEGGPVNFLETWKTIRAGEPEFQELYSGLADFESHGISFTLHRTRGNEGILAMSGPVSPFVSDSDPMTRGMAMAAVVPLDPNPEPDEARRTASALNAYLVHCRRRLMTHPVNRAREEKGLAPLNFLATQRCGRRILTEPFYERWGMKGLMVASGAVFSGIASELGMDFQLVADGEAPGIDLEERLCTALEDTRHDFIHVHTKAPDEAAHRGDPEAKAAVIEALDCGLVPLVHAMGASKDLVAAVTADHATPCGSRLIHSGETVPLLIAGPSVRRDRVGRFDEVSAASGGLGLLRGEELMLQLLNHAERSVLFGHHLGARERAYLPEVYPPFEEKDY
ncbi:MAG: alkaline phosphatase family protein [Thermodesulfobacteriota bacterium]